MVVKIYGLCLYDFWGQFPNSLKTLCGVGYIGTY